MERDYHEEILHEALNDTSEPKKPSTIWKIVLALMSVAVVIMFISYYTTSPQTADILAGYIESSIVREEKINIPDKGTLMFLDDTYGELITLFDDNLGQEFKVCLLGYTEDEDYFITSLHTPITYEQTHNSVRAEPCPEESVVSMHSHPLQHCLPSEIDLQNFERFKEKNKEALLAVMCERERINFYI